MNLRFLSLARHGGASFLSQHLGSRNSKSLSLSKTSLVSRANTSQPKKLCLRKQTNKKFNLWIYIKLVKNKEKGCYALPQLEIFWSEYEHTIYLLLINSIRVKEFCAFMILRKCISLYMGKVIIETGRQT